MNKIICGDCFNVFKELPSETYDLLLTSPPYAEQRQQQYGGISEADYPDWTVQWATLAMPLLTAHGSIAIVIRPHLRNGEISDYVLRTRLALREYLYEAEELIWIKPDAPPLGHVGRPRRSWESILWFSKTTHPYCNSKANGTVSDRVGFETTKGVGDWKAGVKKASKGIARCKDYVEVGTSKVDRSKMNTHPAQYPEPLAAWLIKLLCPMEGVVLDPFCGSGSTPAAAKRLLVNYTGIELSEEYCGYARDRTSAI